MRYIVITVPDSTSCENLLSVVKERGLSNKIAFTSFNSELAQALLEEYPTAGIGVVIDTTSKKVLTSAETAELLKSA